MSHDPYESSRTVADRRETGEQEKAEQELVGV